MLSTLEQKFDRLFNMAGGIVLLAGSGLSSIHLGRRDVARIMHQMLVIGYQTTPLALLIGVFVGMTLALNTGFALETYGQTALIAQVVAISLMREMGPVITAVIITGRVGAAMTAELGTMAVNEEVDVLRVLGIRIERYLVMPRLVASILMTPMLTVYSIIIGFIGGAVVANQYFGVTYLNYKIRTFQALDGEEVFKGLLKTVVFGLLYSMVCCYIGLTTHGGAEGVGRSTTRAVVVSLSSILVANYLLTSFLFR